jgi:hypothetical protein
MENMERVRDMLVHVKSWCEILSKHDVRSASGQRVINSMSEYILQDQNKFLDSLDSDLSFDGVVDSADHQLILIDNFINRLAGTTNCKIVSTSLSSLARSLVSNSFVADMIDDFNISIVEHINDNDFTFNMDIEVMLNFYTNALNQADLPKGLAIQSIYNLLQEACDKLGTTHPHRDLYSYDGPKSNLFKLSVV